ncbi:Fic/DOC family protein [Risungbinella massiliensis]|uniref:Fic/DOC family protein n=1 Tax=Risungbinella massiliensis TaxID=1329796 RepID=UPI0005CBDF98|nr:Fic family protein [Risungbinella massiliensis]
MAPKSYSYPNSDVLINEFHMREYTELFTMEALYTLKRLAQLQKSPIYGKFNLEHLQQIHQFIFQDIYEWAGALREVDIAKQNTWFARTIYLQDVAHDIFGSLHREKCLQGLPLEDFSKRAAFYMAEINMLHPFREGNGRSQREFIRCLALQAGYKLDWSRVPSKQVFQASVASSSGDINSLKEVIRGCIVNEEEADQTYITFYQNCEKHGERL